MASSTEMLNLCLEGGFGVAGLIWLWETVHAKSSRVAPVEDCRGRSHLVLENCAVWLLPRRC